MTYWGDEATGGMFRKNSPAVHTRAYRASQMTPPETVMTDFSGVTGLLYLVDPEQDTGLYADNQWASSMRDHGPNARHSSVGGFDSGSNATLALMHGVINGRAVYRNKGAGDAYWTLTGTNPFAGQASGEVFYVLQYSSGGGVNLGGFGNEASWWGDGFGPHANTNIYSGFGRNESRHTFVPNPFPPHSVPYILSFEARAGLWRCRLNGEIVADLGVNTVCAWDANIALFRGSWPANIGFVLGCVALDDDTERTAITEGLAAMFAITLP